MNVINKKSKKNIEKYLEWLKENFPNYEILEVEYEKKYINLIYKVRWIWVNKYYIIINFNNDWDIIDSTEYKNKLVWEYNISINKEHLNKYLSKEKIIDEVIKIERLKESEINRTSIEKYKTKKIVLVALIPILILFIFIWYIIYIAIIDWELGESLKELALYFLSPVVLWLIIVWFIDDWEDKLKIKNELNYEWKLKYELDYDYDYFYTDSLFTYILYNLVKVTFFLISFAVLGFFAILLFNTIWGIILAPTTIIIILLLIIIYNQNRNKK